MLGIIRTRDIIAHPVVTIRCFGWSIFLRALLARREQTFLSLVCDARHRAAPRTPEVPALLSRCIELEASAQRIYEGLATRFEDRPAAHGFFRRLAREECHHAELLALCREAAWKEGWIEVPFAPWRSAVPELEARMAEAESEAARLDALPDALRLVLRIEGSEVNQIFESVLASTDSPFVRACRPFQVAGQEHLAGLGRAIVALEPGLAGACREAGLLG